MNFLSKLFVKRTRNRSYIQTWVQERMKINAHAKKFSLEILFVSLIYALIENFQQRSDALSKSKPKEILGNQSFVDEVLFEVGCYSVFRIDLWLYMNRPDFREDISDFFVEAFSLLFTKALGDPDLHGLFEKRLNHYGDLARKNVDLTKYHFHLEQLILRSKENNLCKDYTFNRDPIAQAGLMDAMNVKTILICWEPFLDAILKNIGLYCVEQQQPKK